MSYLGPCVEAVGPFHRGYKRVRYEGKMVYLHRLRFAEYLGIPLWTLDGHVLHSCDNTRCVNRRHLRLGTAWENAQDRKARDRGCRLKGELNGCAKLTWEVVRAMRNEYVPRCPNKGGKALAKKYGVSQAMASMILRGEKWQE